MKLPKLDAGKVIHKTAATGPDFLPKSIDEVIHKVIEINRWKIGENNLIDHSWFPNKLVESEIIHAINGGFEKYPSWKLFDQSQYWASSTDNSRGELYKTRTLTKVKINKKETITGKLKMNELDDDLWSENPNLSLFYLYEY